MIRINLLPQKRRTERSEGAQLWLVAPLLCFLIEVVGLFIVHSIQQEKLNKKLQANKELDAQIEGLRKAVANHKDVKDKLAVLRAREDAIAKLQSARSGPTAMLLEMARILTPGRGPSVDPEELARLRRTDPLKVFNPSWDSRRLWIRKFVELQRSVRFEGAARDGEDVSELAKRMELSSYFYDVRLLPAKKQMDPTTKLELVEFQLEAKVRY